MAAVFENFGLTDLVAKPEDALRLATLAAVDGAKIRGYGGNYFQYRMGDALVVVRTAMDYATNESELLGMDTHAVSDSVWECSLVADVTPADFDPLERRLLVESSTGGMASVSQGGSMWLLRRQAAPGERLLPLVIDGDVVFITEADIEPKAVEAIKRHCPWLMLKAHYRFWVFPFGPDGLAAVEWMVQPDGRASADEDGFGMDDGVEVILHGSIDVEGRPAGQFRLYERK